MKELSFKLILASCITFFFGAFMTFGDEESNDLGSGLFLLAVSALCFILGLIISIIEHKEYNDWKNGRTNNK